MTEEKELDFDELNQKRKNLEDDYYDLKDMSKKIEQAEDEEYDFGFKTQNVYKDLESEWLDKGIDFHQDYILDDIRSDFREMSNKSEDNDFNGKQRLNTEMKKLDDEIEDIQNQMRTLS